MPVHYIKLVYASRTKIKVDGMDFELFAFEQRV